MNIEENKHKRPRNRTYTASEGTNNKVNNIMQNLKNIINNPFNDGAIISFRNNTIASITPTTPRVPPPVYEKIAFV